MKNKDNYEELLRIEEEHKIINTQTVMFAAEIYFAFLYYLTQLF